MVFLLYMAPSVSKKTELNPGFYSPFSKDAECCRLTSFVSNNHRLILLLTNSSDYTVSDLRIHITDYQSRSDLIPERKVAPRASGFIRTFNPCDISATIKTFSSHTTIILASLPEFYVHQHTLKVHTVLTHGCFTLYQEFSHIGDHQWLFAEKVVNDADKVVFRRAPARLSARSEKRPAKR